MFGQTTIFRKIVLQKLVANFKYQIYINNFLLMVVLACEIFLWEQASVAN